MAIVNEGDLARAVVYCRVSTDEQGKSGYSIPDQLRELREYADREGYRIVEEVVDDGFTGRNPHRPGLRRVMELAENASIDVVLAKKRNRFFRSRLYRLLWDQDLGELGVKLVALDDTGNRFGDAMQDEFAEWEREEISRRTQDGLQQKVRQGQVIRGAKDPYGLRFDQKYEAFVVYEPEMAVVRFMFQTIAAGGTMHALEQQLERDGVLAPAGGSRWNKTTIRNIITKDLYKPHAWEEVSRYVEPEVAARLDKSRKYGLWTWKERKTKKWKEWNGERYADRYSYTMRPKEEQMFVPVPDASIPDEVVRAAREAIKNNARRPSSAARRVWELSGGFIRCGECGSVLSAHTVVRSDGDKRHFYYQCRRRFNNGPRNCTHGRSYPAAEMEERVWAFVSGMLEDPERLRAGLEEMIEGERRALRGAPDRETRLWASKLVEVNEERRGYQRLAAKGRMTDQELDEVLVELEETRKIAERELQAAKTKQQRIVELERNAQVLFDSYSNLVLEGLQALEPEEKQQIYRMLNLKVILSPDAPLEISGTFGENYSVCRSERSSWRT